MMRILFTRFPLKSANGGAENQTMWLGCGLRDRGHTVSFLGSCPVLLRRFMDDGLAVSPLTIGSPPVTKFGAVSFLWRRKKMYRDLVSSFESMDSLPDVVCMLSLSEKILMTDWLGLRGVKVFWIEHDRIGAWLSKNPWLSSPKTAAKYATMICVSELSRQKYISLGFDSTRVIAIPNGVPEPFSSLPTTPYSLPPTPYSLNIGTIARLSPEKGIDVLLTAITDLPEVSLSIVGKGLEEAFLRSMMTEDERRIGVPRITLQRCIPDLDVFMSSLDVFILASTDHDPFGLVIAEAMIRGVPVIVTDHCGIAGYLTDGNDALIIETVSPLALKNAIVRLRDADLRSKIADQGIKTAKTLFGLEKMVDAYIHVLHKD